MINPPSFAVAEVNPAPFGYFPGTRIPRKSPARDDFGGKGVCKRCGKAGLVWEMITEDSFDIRRTHWELQEIGGERHVCKVKP